MFALTNQITSQSFKTLIREFPLTMLIERIELPFPGYKAGVIAVILNQRNPSIEGNYYTKLPYP